MGLNDFSFSPRIWLKKYSSWDIWLNRLQESFGQLWKKVGHFNFIKMTCTYYTNNNLLVSPLSYSQSLSCNTFLLPYIPMIVTLLDIPTLTSLLVTKIVINANLLINGLLVYDFLLISTNHTFN